MPKIEIYSRQGCSFCERAKQFLTSKKMKFTEIRVDNDQERLNEMLVRSQGAKTVPQIYINDRFIGGFDDMVALDKAGKLDMLLIK